MSSLTLTLFACLCGDDVDDAAEYSGGGGVALLPVANSSLLDDEGVVYWLWESCGYWGESDTWRRDAALCGVLYTVALPEWERLLVWRGVRGVGEHVLTAEGIDETEGEPWRWYVGAVVPRSPRFSLGLLRLAGVEPYDAMASRARASRSLVHVYSVEPRRMKKMPAHRPLLDTIIRCQHE